MLMIRVCIAAQSDAAIEGRLYWECTAVFRGVAGNVISISGGAVHA